MKTYLIDDDVLGIYLTEHLLRREGFSQSITSFQSAELALQTLLHDSGSRPPDVIFLDLNMPLMSGWDFLDALAPYRRQLLGRCHIYILTSSLALADLDQGIAQRRRDHAPTPWHYVQVRGVALTSLGNYGAARATYFQVLQAHPRDGRTHFLLGRLAAHTRDSVAACEFYRRALTLGYEYARPAAEGCN